VKVVPTGPWVGFMENVAVGEDAPEFMEPSGPAIMSMTAVPHREARVSDFRNERVVIRRGDS
jgi:hypothetical protein